MRLLLLAISWLLCLLAALLPLASAAAWHCGPEFVRAGDGICLYFTSCGLILLLVGTGWLVAMIAVETKK